MLFVHEWLMYMCRTEMLVMKTVVLTTESIFEPRPVSVVFRPSMTCGQRFITPMGSRKEEKRYP